jgi:hypothetical protein
VLMHLRVIVRRGERAGRLRLRHEDAYFGV